MKTVKFKRTDVTVGLMTLLWLLYTLTIPAPSHAAIFFDTDFETCTMGTSSDFPCESWNDFETAQPGHLEVTSALAFSGTKSVKGTWDNINGSSQQPSIHRAITPSTYIFARFATRASAGFQYSANGFTKMVKFKGSYGYPMLWIHNVYGQYAVIIEGPYDRAGGYVLYSGIAPSSTSWDQLELEYKFNTPGQANGHVRFWVNGVLRIEHLNHEYIGPTPDSIGPHGLANPSTVTISDAQIYVQSGLGSIYYDRFAVGNTRIGPTQSKSTSVDSTPPTSPKDFQAH